MQEEKLILVVDDDPNFRKTIAEALTKAAFRTAEAADGKKALEMFHKIHPDLVILDIAMPEMDGDEVCRTIRKTHATPVIFLTAMDEEGDRIRGLELGGDDYVVKSGNFSSRELVARVRALLRRVDGCSTPAPTQELLWGPLRLDLNTFQAFWEDRNLNLTTVEFNILHLLLIPPRRAYTRNEIMDRAYMEPTHEVTDRTIDSHIRGIRRKINEAGGRDIIETVRGRGYMIGPADAGQA
jgi:two-component system OmpR family response regulator